MTTPVGFLLGFGALPAFPVAVRFGALELGIAVALVLIGSAIGLAVAIGRSAPRRPSPSVRIARRRNQTRTCGALGTGSGGIGGAELAKRASTARAPGVERIVQLSANCR